MSTAMQNGLGLNETLESLELSNVHLPDIDFALWRRAFAFLRTNKTLKVLDHQVERCDASTSSPLLYAGCDHAARERVT
jgi:hypothetical protein